MTEISVIETRDKKNSKVISEKLTEFASRADEFCTVYVVMMRSDGSFITSQAGENILGVTTVGILETIKADLMEEMRVPPA